MTTAQKAIFLAVALSISLIINAFLFLDLTARQETMQALTLVQQDDALKTAELKSKVAENEQQAQQWQSNYRELSTIVEELRKELNAIVNQQASASNTAVQAEQSVKNARQQIAELETNLVLSAQQRRQLEQNLVNADATIANLQRALRSNQSSSSTEFDNSALLANLSASVRALQATGKIGITETQQGDIRLSVPNEWLFNLGTVDLTEQSQQLAQLLVANLASANRSLVLEIIGHSDERLIVSALAERYPSNWELSAVRAGKIANLLVELGWNNNDISAVGKAATQPVRAESGAEAWQINRRVDIVIRSGNASSGS